jgi:hypothetical protein
MHVAPAWRALYFECKKCAFCACLSKCHIIRLLIVASSNVHSDIIIIIESLGGAWGSTRYLCMILDLFNQCEALAMVQVIVVLWFSKVYEYCTLSVV